MKQMSDALTIAMQLLTNLWLTPEWPWFRELPLFKYWPSHSMVWNIPLLSLGPLSQLCSLPASFVYFLIGRA